MYEVMVKVPALLGPASLVAASPILMGLVAAAVVEWESWPHEVSVFAALTGVAFAALVRLRIAVGKRLDALEERFDRHRS